MMDFLAPGRSAASGLMSDQRKISAAVEAASTNQRLLVGSVHPAVRIVRQSCSCFPCVRPGAAACRLAILRWGIFRRRGGRSGVLRVFRRVGWRLGRGSARGIGLPDFVVGKRTGFQRCRRRRSGILRGGRIQRRSQPVTQIGVLGCHQAATHVPVCRAGRARLSVSLRGAGLCRGVRQGGAAGRRWSRVRSGGRSWRAGWAWAHDRQRDCRHDAGGQQQGPEPQQISFGRTMTTHAWGDPPMFMCNQSCQTVSWNFNDYPRGCPARTSLAREDQAFCVVSIERAARRGGAGRAIRLQMKDRSATKTSAPPSSHGRPPSVFSNAIAIIGVKPPITDES